VFAEFEKDPALVCLSGPYVYYDLNAGQRFLVGMFYGLTTLIYWINALLLLLPALDLLPPFVQALRARGWHTSGRLILGGLLFLAATLVTFSPQMIAWKILYGSPFTIPHGSPSPPR